MSRRTCLILNEFTMLMRNEKCDFKKLDLPKTIVVSLTTKISEKSKKKFGIFISTEEIKFLLSKIKNSWFLQEQLSQPVFQLNYSFQI